ncbi:hypothetical protein PPYR_13763 [Photinus pyralis]|uniref:Glyoxylate reductase/hydroxypyruvate reductase n=1 Tax=Photinus pyralis TaxID=7054 RepID=A0A1Y1KXC6_PHOPY|nr:glyoxylate reductase/hydroxypyruvate reductase-like [Photinus pyralis]XP_031355416.1 glyoxylate reductase/hydroxypyruvate reductase-like [Photinus pyralis]KAB0793707.1 hypothetical protein PPYR_13327 [Photinus pyralis]KAB0794143.1 hypothetical protein PPYR_13763 [Photinus pyralis]
MEEVKKKVLISTNDVPQIGIDLLRAEYNTTVNDVNTKASLVDKVPGVSALFWSTKVKLDVDILNAAGPQLEVVAAMSAGLDNIDVEELKRRNIKLSNTPGVLNAAVADIAVLLALAASRRLREGQMHIQNNTWAPNLRWMLGKDLKGSTVGIVGLGEIGKAIVKRLKAFEVHKFVYCGRAEKPEGKELGAEFVTFDDLLSRSDFVIASCPLMPETKEMFDETAFKKMKSTSIFVNIGRGGLVDQAALVKALKENTIFAAGLDVMVPEPLPSDHELVQLPNCFLSPHLGSATQQTRSDMARLAAQNVIAALSGEKLITPVY